MFIFDDEPQHRVRIEIIPMIDVMMFLLVFFVMISLNVIPITGLKTELPQASQTTSVDAVKHLIITLAADGHMEIEGRTYPMTALPGLIRAQASQHPKLDVIINGDRNARIDSLVKVMDEVRSQGIQQVAIATKKAP